MRGATTAQPHDLSPRFLRPERFNTEDAERLRAEAFQSPEITETGPKSFMQEVAIAIPVLRS